MKINVLSTSNTTSQSPATVGRAAQGAPGNFPGDLGQAHVKITSTTPPERVREERAREGRSSGRRAKRQAGNALSEPAPRTPAYRYKLQLQQGGGNNTGKRPRINKVQTVYPVNLHVVACTKACKYSHITFKSGCVGEYQNQKPNFNKATSCNSLIGTHKSNKALKRPTSG